MYCYTVANSYVCILRELQMWTEISSEHPIFIKTVAQLSKKKLPEELVDSLTKISNDFKNLNQTAKDLCYEFTLFPMDYVKMYGMIKSIKKALRDFERLDKLFLNILKETMKYGEEDKVWQTLLEHIREEQIYMYRLFGTLYSQLDGDR